MHLPFSKVIEVFAIVLVPVGIGMVVRATATGWAQRMDKPVRIGSAVILAILVLGILLDQRENVGDYMADVGVVAAVFCAISLVTGYVVPRAAGVRGDQAIASSMEIGVHNGTLAIFVAVEILDSTEISVPAAVYSIIMFVFAALWGVVVSRWSKPPSHEWRQRPERLAAMADRVLVLDRQLGGGGTRVVVGDEEHVVAEPAAAADLPDDPAVHPAVDHDLVAVGVAERNSTGEVRGPPGVRDVGELGEQQLVVAGVRPGWAGPARGEHARHAVERVDAQPGVVGHRGQPGRGQPGAGLEQRVALEGRLVLDGLVVRRHVVEPEHLDRGQVSAQDPLHLRELLGVPRGQEDAGPS